MYISNQQVYNSNEMNGHKSFISNNFKWDISENKGVLHCEAYYSEKVTDEIMEAPSPECFSARRMEMLSRPDGFMLYAKLEVDFFSTSELLFPNMKNRLRLIRASPNFFMTSENPDVSVGIVDCSICTRCNALKDVFHKKRMDMLAYIPVKSNYLETLAKTFIIPLRQNQWIIKKHFQQCSSSSDCFCNDYKLCIHWSLNWKIILLSTIRSQTN